MLSFVHGQNSAQTTGLHHIGYPSEDDTMLPNRENHHLLDD
jgi:hypothetical protein